VIRRDTVTLGILAGGQARRLGGVDKAFVEYRRQPLVERCLQAAGNGFAAKLVSHPANDVRFSAQQLRAVADLRPGQPGPLAGLEALLVACDSDWLLSLPVDARELPPVVFETLLRVDDPGAGCVIRDGDGLQPLCALWRVDLARGAVAARLDAGQRDAHGLVASLGLVVCDLSPLRLGNLNSPEDLQDVAP